VEKAASKLPVYQQGSLESAKSECWQPRRELLVVPTDWPVRSSRVQRKLSVDSKGVIALPLIRGTWKHGNLGDSTAN